MSRPDRATLGLRLLDLLESGVAIAPWAMKRDGARVCGVDLRVARASDRASRGRLGFVIGKGVSTRDALIDALRQLDDPRIPT